MNDAQAQRIIKAIVEEHAGTVELEPRYLTDEETGTPSGRIIARIEVWGVQVYAVGVKPGIADALAEAEQRLRMVLDLMAYTRLSPEAP
jgi:hypothetical protein